jgi:hypothetical protein
MSGWGIPVVAALLAVGAVGAAVTLAAHESDTAFLYEQQHPAASVPRQLEALIEKTREPVASGRRSPVVAARCAPRAGRWACAVRYASGHAIAYRVSLRPNRSFYGTDASGVRSIRGCCIASPAPS